MDVKKEESPLIITPETVIVDIISRYRETEKIFKQLEEKTGVCICCKALFVPIGEAAERFGFNITSVIADICAVIEKGGSQ